MNPLTNETEQIKQSVSFDKELHERIKSVAKAEKRPFSSMVRVLVEEALKARKDAN